MSFLRKLFGSVRKSHSVPEKPEAESVFQAPESQSFTREELLARIAEDPNVCSRGYDFAEFDRRGYCLWVIDCCKHVFPLAERYLSNEEMSRLNDSLETARRHLDGEANFAAVEAAVVVPRSIMEKYSASENQIPHDLFETLAAAENAVKLTLPNAKVYHEDVIYGTARAACAGQLHQNDSSGIPEPADCNRPEELAGTDESQQEKEWQLLALRKRVSSFKAE